MNSRNRRLAGALIAAGALAVPATASADSIVYVRHGNVYVAKPSGAHAVRITSGGHWNSPTQSDKGTIAAVNGTGPIQILRRDGKLLHTIKTPFAKSGDGGTFAPHPVALSLSPDGRKLAYSYVANSCPIASTCGTIQRATFYTKTNVRKATPIRVYGEQFGESDPEWVSNSRTTLFGGFGQQGVLDDVGGGTDSFGIWLKPDFDLADGEVSRDGRRFAATVFYGPNKVISFYSVKGSVRRGIPPLPDVACQLTNKDEKNGDPSWSPDARSVAYEDRQGVKVLRFTKFGPDLCGISHNAKLIAKGAHSPDWGPANPPRRAAR